MTVLPRARAVAVVEELLEELDRWATYAQETNHEATRRQRELYERVCRAVRVTALGNDVHARDSEAVAGPGQRIVDLTAEVQALSGRCVERRSELERAVTELDAAHERLTVALRYNAAELSAQPRAQPGGQRGAAPGRAVGRGGRGGGRFGELVVDPAVEPQLATRVGHRVGARPGRADGGHCHVRADQVDAGRHQPAALRARIGDRTCPSPCR